MTVLGPRILGHATDLIFAGVIGKDSTASDGTYPTKDEVVQASTTRAHGTRPTC